MLVLSTICFVSVFYTLVEGLQHCNQINCCCWMLSTVACKLDWHNRRRAAASLFFRVRRLMRGLPKIEFVPNLFVQNTVCIPSYCCTLDPKDPFCLSVHQKSLMRFRGDIEETIQSHITSHSKSRDAHFLPVKITRIGLWMDTEAS